MKPTKELALAAAAGDLQQARALLEADPALAQDWQPLMDAALAGQAEAVKLLLAHGADPNVVSKTPFRHRPLHRAIEHKSTMPKHEGHLEVVRVLLAGGADVNARAMYNNVPPLTLAAMGGQLRFIPILLEHGARRDIFTAAVLGDAAAVRQLLERDPGLARAEDEGGWSALKYCAASRVGRNDPEAAEGLREVARLLVAQGADPIPALDDACFANRPDVVELALKAGADPSHGDRVVHTAEAEHYECLELLVKYGADLDCTVGTEHHGGHGPVGSLVGMRRATGVKWLLEHGADVNLKAGPRGETPLHAAVRGGCSPETVKILLEHGADTALPDGAGDTPLAAALAANKPKLVDLLRQHGAAE